MPCAWRSIHLLHVVKLGSQHQLRQQQQIPFLAVVFCMKALSSPILPFLCMSALLRPKSHSTCASIPSFATTGKKFTKKIGTGFISLSPSLSLLSLKAIGRNIPQNAYLASTKPHTPFCRPLPSSKSHNPLCFPTLSVLHPTLFFHANLCICAREASALCRPWIWGHPHSYRA